MVKLAAMAAMTPLKCLAKALPGSRQFYLRVITARCEFVEYLFQGSLTYSIGGQVQLETGEEGGGRRTDVKGGGERGEMGLD